MRIFTVVSTFLFHSYSFSILFHSYSSATFINVYYSIVLLFILGSHQNVFTMRLVEDFSLTAKNVKLLDLDLFPGYVRTYLQYSTVQ